MEPLCDLRLSRTPSRIGPIGNDLWLHPHADKLLECGSRYGPENPKALSGGMLANPTRGLSRREMLSILAKGALAYPLAKTGLYGTVRGHQSSGVPSGAAGVAANR